MATRIDWKVSVTPIIGLADVTEGASGADVLSADIKGSIGGGNSSGTWTGADITGWVTGDCTHKDANGGTIDTPASCVGVWVKNTGKKYDAGEDFNLGLAANADSKVSLTIGGVIVAILASGEGMFFPDPADSDTAFITFDDIGTDDVAVEYAIFV